MNITVLPHHADTPEKTEQVEVYEATIRVLIEVPEDVPQRSREAYACDAVSEGLRGLFVDWAYEGPWPTPTVINNPHIEGEF